MKQFHFSSNLSTLMELYLTTRNEEGYLSDHYGYYLQELDCLSKARLTSWTNAEPNAILSAVTGGATSRTIAGRSLTTE